LGFIAFLLTSFSKIGMGDAVSSPYPIPPPPLCASMEEPVVKKKMKNKFCFVCLFVAKMKNKSMFFN
jgi:hypothetical protein